MKPLPPDLALALGDLAHVLGDLWAIEARLVALPASRDLAAEAMVETAHGVAGELRTFRDRLARIAEALPSVSPETSSDTGLSPLELVRASVECVLADRLDPAIADLTRVGTELDSRWAPARASLECALADQLHPAIEDLTRLLVLGGDPAHVETSSL